MVRPLSQKVTQSFYLLLEISYPKWPVSTPTVSYAPSEPACDFNDWPYMLISWAHTCMTNVIYKRIS
jgi:hypothetical protein